MQQYITKEILDAVGIEIPSGTEEAELLKYLNEALAENIGKEIADSLEEDQIDEMMTIQQSGDMEKLQTWLKQNVPDLQEIAEDERDILLGEIAENADKLNEIARS